MVRKGREKTRKQYTLRTWAIGGGPLGKENEGKETEEDRADKEDRRDEKGEVKKRIR